MVVQSVALPNVSGVSRDHEIAGTATESAPVPVAATRSFHASVLVPLLVVAQGAWLAGLGYAALRLLS